YDQVFSLRDLWHKSVYEIGRLRSIRIVENRQLKQMKRSNLTPFCSGVNLSVHLNTLIVKKIRELEGPSRQINSSSNPMDFPSRASPVTSSAPTTGTLPRLRTR